IQEIPIGPNARYAVRHMPRDLNSAKHIGFRSAFYMRANLMTEDVLIKERSAAHRAMASNRQKKNAADYERNMEMLVGNAGERPKANVKLAMRLMTTVLFTFTILMMTGQTINAIISYAFVFAVTAQCIYY